MPKKEAAVERRKGHPTALAAAPSLSASANGIVGTRRVYTPLWGAQTCHNALSFTDAPCSLRTERVESLFTIICSEQKKKGFPIREALF